MKGKINIFTIVLISIVLVIPAQAGLKKVGQTGLQFLKTDLSARSAGMGSAFTMMGNDANSLFHNPSGIAYSESGYDFFFTRTTWIADITYLSGGLVKNFDQWGSVGIHFASVDYGDIIGTRITDTERGFEETDNVDVSAYVVGLAYAKQLSNKFAMGGQIKYVGQKLGESELTLAGETVENKVSGLAYEFGTTFYPGLLESFRFGMSVKNFSQEFQYEQEGFQLPLTYFIGIAFDALEMVGDTDKEKHSLTIAVDAVHPRDYSERVHFGAEYWFMNMFALRTGYKFNYDEEDISFGFGLNIFNVKVDYAFSNFGVFDNVNRISIGASF